MIVNKLYLRILGFAFMPLLNLYSNISAGKDCYPVTWFNQLSTESLDKEITHPDITKIPYSITKKKQFKICKNICVLKIYEK
jgi:hypothetical protein